MIKWLRNESLEHESSARAWDNEHAKHIAKYKVVKYGKKWWLQEHLSNDNYNDLASFDTVNDAKTAAELLWDRIPAIPTDEDEAMRGKR